jgi:hypothetical protein
MERRAVYAVLRAAQLRRRKGKSRGATGGKFLYVARDDREARRWISFEWDGAGYDANGGLVVLEAELAGSLNASHIQSHLTRLAIMEANGDPVARVIWIIRPSRKRQLEEIIANWRVFFEAAASCELPPMEAWSQDGALIPGEDGHNG